MVKWFLFEAVKLTKNFDPDKYGYSGYSNGSVLSLVFDLIIVLLCMLIITKVLGEGPTQELDDSTITAETKYPISFTQWK